MERADHSHDFKHLFVWVLNGLNVFSAVVSTLFFVLVYTSKSVSMHGHVCTSCANISNIKCLLIYLI